MATVVRKGLVCEHCGKFLDFSYGLEDAVAVVCLYCRSTIEANDDLLVTLRTETTNTAGTQGHTPGPWVVYYDDDGVEIRAGADGGDVMGMFIHGEEMDANARLLASAPALLGALENLVGWFGAVDYTDYESGEIDESQLDWVGLHRVFHRAEAAIAKARGGA